MRSLFVCAAILAIACISCNTPDQPAAEAQIQSQLCQAPAPQPRCECHCDCEARLVALEQRLDHVQAYATQLREYAVWHLQPDKRQPAKQEAATLVPTAATGHWEERCNGRTCTRVWVSH